MGTAGAIVDRQHSTWVWFGYWIVAAGLRTLYVRMSDAVGASAPAANLPAWWWFLPFLYFVVDVVIVLAAKFFQWTFTSTKARKPFMFEVARIVPIWLLLHLMMLFLEYPVSSRLEAVGLRLLEFFVFMALMTVCVAEFFKDLSTRSESTVD